MKVLIFQKAASPVALAVNYLTGIFHGFPLSLTVHLCSRVPLIENTFQWVFSFLWMPFKTNFVTYYLFSEEKIIIPGHTL